MIRYFLYRQKHDLSNAYADFKRRVKDGGIAGMLRTETNVNNSLDISTQLSKISHKLIAIYKLPLGFYLLKVNVLSTNAGNAILDMLLNGYKVDMKAVCLYDGSKVSNIIRFDAYVRS